jgi:hypothetical protein
MEAKNEREFVALYLEHQAREVRRGFVAGFELKWKAGTGEVEGTNIIIPQHPIKFVTIPVGTLEDDKET